MFVISYFSLGLLLASDARTYGRTGPLAADDTARFVQFTRRMSFFFFFSCPPLVIFRTALLYFDNADAPNTRASEGTAPAAPLRRCQRPARLTTRSAGRSWDCSPSWVEMGSDWRTRVGAGRAANVQRVRYTTCKNDSKERCHRPTTLALRRTLRNALFCFFSSILLHTGGPSIPRGPDASTTSLSKAGTRTESRALGKR